MKDDPSELPSIWLLVLIILWVVLLLPALLVVELVMRLVGKDPPRARDNR
jgi:hypothetical protein